METYELTLCYPLSFHIFHRRLRNGRCLTYRFDGARSIKHILESIGIPHTEIGKIEVDGTAVTFDFIPIRNASVCVYAIDPPFRVTAASPLRPQPLESLKFVADVNVGRLACLLRMAGFDTEYHPDHTDGAIARMAAMEGRVVLSKDTGLLKRREVVYGRYVRGIHPDDQLQEIVRFFGIRRASQPFSRCLHCNTPLVAVEKAAIVHRLELKTRKYFDRFKMCSRCDRIYWQGSHHSHMSSRMQMAGIVPASDD